MQLDWAVIQPVEPRWLPAGPPVLITAKRHRADDDPPTHPGKERRLEGQCDFCNTVTLLTHGYLGTDGSQLLSCGGDVCRPEGWMEEELDY